MIRPRFRTLAAALAVTLLAAPAPAAGPGEAAAAQEAARQEIWAGLVTDVFEGRPMQKGDGVIELQAPARAEDAALVPMTIRTRAGPGAPKIRKITLVIDENPAPVAAVFTLGDKAGVTEITTRVRVNAYTKVHAVAEAEDGTLYMVERFVKASGGCSAPAVKDPDEAAANLGRMKMRWFDEGTDAAAAPQSTAGLREAQIMVRHPNNSGLQMDQVTRLYIPAHFVNDLTVKQGDDLVFRMEGGISISEDPSFRFTYRPNGATSFRVEAEDTEGNRFAEEFPLPASS